MTTGANRAAAARGNAGSGTTGPNIATNTMIESLISRLCRALIWVDTLISWQFLTWESTADCLMKKSSLSSALYCRNRLCRVGRWLSGKGWGAVAALLWKIPIPASDLTCSYSLHTTTHWKQRDHRSTELSDHWHRSLTLNRQTFYNRMHSCIMTVLQVTNILHYYFCDDLKLFEFNSWHNNFIMRGEKKYKLHSENQTFTFLFFLQEGQKYSAGSSFPLLPLTFLSQ